MRVALDTNVVAYAEGINGEERQATALQLIERLPAGAAVIPAQAMGELFQLLIRKGGRTRELARAAVLSWRDSFPLIETTEAVLVSAAELAATHRLSIWDGIILASAAEAGCRLLLSEDLQEGFTWNKVTVTNPFGPTLHPLLENLLRPDVQ